jgi:hypothetical protein
MSVKAICINDSNRPKEIPPNKWVKKDNEYEIIFTCTAMPQKVLAFQLAEIELTNDHLPYEYFKADRFAFTEENLLLLQQLIKDCEDIDFSIEELMKQTELETIKD